MPSTIIATTELAQGDLVLLSQSANFSTDGTEDYRATYACLSQFTHLHAGKFVRKAGPPKAIGSGLQRNVLELYNVEIVRERGITYFNASYGGHDLTVFEETETETLKTFSETVSQPDTFTNNIVTGSLTFDYISKTVTVTSKFFYRRTKKMNQLVSYPFNIVTSGKRKVSYRITEVVTQSVATAASGQKTYTTNATGIYVVIK